MNTRSPLQGTVFLGFFWGLLLVAGFLGFSFEDRKITALSLTGETATDSSITVVCTAGEFIEVSFLQESRDVVVVIKSPRGEQIVVDSPNGETGPECAFWIAGEDGPVVFSSESDGKPVPGKFVLVHRGNATPKQEALVAGQGKLISGKSIQTTDPIRAMELFAEAKDLFKKADRSLNFEYAEFALQSTRIKQASSREDAAEKLFQCGQRLAALGELQTAGFAARRAGQTFRLDLNLAKAEQVLRQAEVWSYSTPDKKNTGLCLLEMSLILESSRRMEEARLTATRALAFLPENSNPWLIALANLGRFQFELGERSVGRKNLIQAWEGLNRLNNRQVAPSIAMNISRVDFLLGDAVSAERWARVHALPYLDEKKSPCERAQCLAHLSNILQSQGRLAEAFKLHTEAEAGLATCQDNGWKAVPAFRRASLLEDLGDPNASDSFKRAVRETLNLNAFEMTAWANLGVARTATDLKERRTAANAALDLFEQSGTIDGRIAAYATLATIDIEAGEFAAAEKMGERAASLYELGLVEGTNSDTTPELRKRLAFVRAKTALQKGEPEEAFERVQRVYGFSLSGNHARDTSESAAVTQLQKRARGLAAALLLARKSSPEAVAGLRQNLDQTELDAVELMRRQLETTKGKAYAGNGSQFFQLDGPECKLFYLTGDRSTLLFSVFKGKITTFELASGRKLGNLAFGMLQAIERANASGSVLDLALVGQVAASFLPPGAVPEDAQRIIVGQDGSLPALPFQVLFSKMRRLPIVTHWVRRSLPQDSFSGKEVIAVLSPHSGKSELGLPGAAREGTEILNTFPVSARLRIDPTQTDWHLARAVHLAGHGEIDGRVLVVPDDDFPAITPIDFLTHRLKADCLVLAACESGRGLASAALQSGARGVVSFVTPVDDQAAKRLCLRFWQEVARGKDYATALTIAQEAERAKSAAWAAVRFDGETTASFLSVTSRTGDRAQR